MGHRGVSAHAHRTRQIAVYDPMNEMKRERRWPPTRHAARSHWHLSRNARTITRRSPRPGVSRNRSSAKCHERSRWERTASLPPPYRRRQPSRRRRWRDARSPSWRRPTMRDKSRSSRPPSVEPAAATADHAHRREAQPPDVRDDLGVALELKTRSVDRSWSTGGSVPPHALPVNGQFLEQLTGS